MDMGRSLQTFLVHFGESDIIIGDEAGVFFMRNTKCVVSLVEGWLGTKHGIYGDGLDDGALEHMLVDTDIRVKRVTCMFSSYHLGLAHRGRGDFAVHLAGDRWKMDACQTCEHAGMRTPLVDGDRRA